MKAIDDNSSGDDDRRLDLLVDGELSELQRRELLEALDQEPGGWRRCALAFLEAQCWKQELPADLLGADRSAAATAAAGGQDAGGQDAGGQDAGGQDAGGQDAGGQDAGGQDARAPEPAASPGAGRQARRVRQLRHLGTLAAMAASFLVALYLGTLWQQMWHDRGAAGTSGTTMADNRQSGSPAQRPSDSQPLVAQSKQPTGPSSGTWRTVILPLPAGPEGQVRSIELPAVERQNIDDAWLQSLPPAVPPDVIQALERTGYRLRQHRALVPLEMKDGRQLVVPIDQVEVHYVGNQAY